MERALLIKILGGETTFIDAAGAGDIVLDGDPAALIMIFGNLDQFDNTFAIVEP